MLIFGIADDETILGLPNARKDSETISEQIKVKMDPISTINLRFEKVADYGQEDKTLLILEVSEGTQPPYYYVGDGNRIAYHRIGNESVPVDGMALRELVLKGSNYSHDSLQFKYGFENYAFTKLKSVYKQRTYNSFEEEEYESWGIMDALDDKEFSGSIVSLLQNGTKCFGRCCKCINS